MASVSARMSQCVDVDLQALKGLGSPREGVGSKFARITAIHQFKADRQLSTRLVIDAFCFFSSQQWGIFNITKDITIVVVGDSLEGIQSR